MSTPPDGDGEREHLTLAEEQEYARLWADLTGGPAHPEELPDEVSARLDEVLADLTAERDASVTSLAARRRRRQRGRWVLAAAAVAAGGFALGPMLTQGAQEDALSTAEDAAGGALDAGGDSAGRNRAGGEDEPRGPATDQAPQALTDLPALRPGLLAEDVAALLASDVPPVGEETPTATSGGDPLDTSDGREASRRDLSLEVGCAPPPAGRWWVVRYDDRRAVLAVLDAAGEPSEHRAELWRCRGGDEPVTTVPLPQ